MPGRYPREFREDVVRVARSREPGQQLRQIAADFGISESCLTNWIKATNIEDGRRLGATAEQNADLREARKRIRLNEQDNEVLTKAAMHLPQANPPHGRIDGQSRRSRRQRRHAVVICAAAEERPEPATLGHSRQAPHRDRDLDREDALGRLTPIGYEMIIN